MPSTVLSIADGRAAATAPSEAHPAAPPAALSEDPYLVAARLRPLAREGAYIAADADGLGIHSPRNGFVAPVARLVPELVALAAARGWLKSGPDGRSTLTRKGLEQIKARLSAGPAATDAVPAEVPVPRRPAPAPTVNPDESPLGWLRRRRDKDGRPLIDETEFEAGERLRCEFWRARKSPRVTASWNPVARSRGERRATPGQGVELSDAVIAAGQRVSRALAAVGPELAGVLIDVCGHMKGLEEIERERCWPQRSGKIVLHLALTRLARHYGLRPPDNGAWLAQAKIRHWGSEDYRPTLDDWR